MPLLFLDTIEKAVSARTVAATPVAMIAEGYGAFCTGMGWLPITKYITKRFRNEKRNPSTLCRLQSHLRLR